MGRPESSKGKMSIISYGGVGGLVTGSSHLIESKGSKFLIDLGMFQGRREERSERGERRNLTSLSEIERGLNQVVITHAHCDHSARVPKLYADDFRPETLATEATVAFMWPLLNNSADIQQSQYAPGDRIYNRHDVETTFRHVRGVKSFKEIPIGQKNSNMTVEFLLNGHVEGSSSILFRNYNNNKNVLFTGDMGKPVQSLCGGYTDFMDKYPQDPIDVLMIESTNFEKEPVLFEDKRREILDTIQSVWAGGGNSVFPVLSFHRCQELMEMIHNGQKNGNIPVDCEIIIDSPLAMEITDVYKKLGPKYLSPRYGNDPNFYKTDEESISRFDLKNLRVINSHEESVYNDATMAKCGKKVIILAGGGMGDHGRSVNYLKGDFCKNPKNAVVYTCYQVEGTYGANMLYNEKCSKENKEKYSKDKKTGAQVYKIEGFTSHISGPEETFDFLGRFNLENLKTVIIGHGKESAGEKMAEEFIRRGYQAKIIRPGIRQSIEF
ncbi:MAG: MBL fold metallo-hydrolase [Candidatus Shapirobacteria bacterium]|nr:MBL fold metallo-hydrolase [Candidatus Shapirobacteria bacterium]MDD4410374.1 MBL fold metallo-hydrolase [Candidatus Shapirobacteria bacterium]